MLLNKSYLKEEGYLADELIEERGISPLDRKCIVAKQAIADGDFSLDQALEAYCLTKEQYSACCLTNFSKEQELVYFPFICPRLAGISVFLVLILETITK